LKSVDIKQLQSKYETFIKEIEAKLEYDEEINDLEKRNQKLTAKLNELETIMPILSERIADLDDINRNLVSNKCFSKSRLVLEDSEVKNI
jgi:predicted RNase H-like nuclease (RuvC/YqgF family)